MARFRLPSLRLRRRTRSQALVADARRVAAKLTRRLGKASKRPPAKAAPPSKARARPLSRREAKAQLRLERRTRQEARLSTLGFLGYALLAGLIVAWPRLQGEGGSPAADPAAAEAAEPRRGRSAPQPLKIPLQGWRDIFSRTWREFGQDRIMATAGGVTFFTLLAVFPALGAFVSLYGLFSDVGEAEKQLRLLAGFMPHDILGFVGDEMIRIAGTRHQGLGVAFVVGLLLSVWSANGAVKALFDGLNVAYEERETRGFVTLNLVSLAFTFGALVFVVVALAAIVAAPPLLRWFGLDTGSIWLAELRWPVMLAMLAGGLSLLYRYGPSRARARWVWLTPGSLFAAVMWLAASLLFSFYVSHFGSFNRTYGSLGAAIGFMTWLWYSTIIVLVGAELNAEVEHQTAVDTTTGEPLPMGVRGAHMADTLGPARGTARAAAAELKAKRHPRGR